MENMIRLPLQGATNVRELGGYATQNGKSTKWHAFLRGDDQSRLTCEDQKCLKEYGVTTILDLRSDAELRYCPDAMATDTEIDYVHVSMLNGEIDDATQIAAPNPDFDLGDLYVQMLQDLETVKKVLLAIAHAKKGCILFHCSAGKDRTGVLSMLLLGIAGVAKQDILTNYQQTFINIKEKMLAQAVSNENVPMHFMYSNPEMIEKAYDAIINQYSGFEAYYQALGLSDDEIKSIRSRIVEA